MAENVVNKLASHDLSPDDKRFPVQQRSETLDKWSELKGEVKSITKADYQPDYDKQGKFRGDFDRVFTRLGELLKTKGVTSPGNLGFEYTPAAIISTLLLAEDTVRIEEERDYQAFWKNRRLANDYPMLQDVAAVVAEGHKNFTNTADTIETAKVDLDGEQIGVSKMDVTPLFLRKGSTIPQAVVSIHNLKTMQEGIPGLAMYLSGGDDRTTNFAVIREGLMEKTANDLYAGEVVKSAARGVDKAVNFATRWLTDLPRTFTIKPVVAGSIGERYSLYAWSKGKDRGV